MSNFLTSLNVELTTDPVAMGYAGHTAGVATDPYADHRLIHDSSLRATGTTQCIPIMDTENLVREAGKWVQWNDKANERDPTTGAISNHAMYEIMSVFTTRISEINWRDAYWSGLLDQAVADGDLGAAAAEGFKAQSDCYQSRAAELNYARVTVQNIVDAYALSV